VELVVDGMTCGNCVRKVTAALLSVPGVQSATADAESGRTIVSAGTGVKPESLIKAVVQAGYGARLASPASGEPEVESTTPWRWALLLGLPTMVSLMVAEWGFGWGMQPVYHWVAFAFALPVQILVGGSFYLGAWRQARVGESSMDTLVALGSSAAFGYSLWGLLTAAHGHLYFMEAVSILTLVGVGHWLEARLSRQAAGTLRSLLELAPTEARRWTAQGETPTPIRSLVVGDLIVLKPGDRVPVDAIVTDGTSAIDESMLTGEPMPVQKRPGDALYAGTLNQNGRMIARITATGESTSLAQIIAAVRRAQSSRAQIQRLADRISQVFVPVVVVLALLTGLGWAFAFPWLTTVHDQLAPWLWPTHPAEGPATAAWMGLTAVLIVACPCAMGLATPVALMAGLNAAAKQGILVRDALALEKSGRVTTILLDKTGTLTEGHPALAALNDCREPNAEPLLLPLAYAMATPSQHPLSRALSGALNVESSLSTSPFRFRWAAPPEMATWVEHPGQGIEATTRDGGISPWYLGSVSWMTDLGVDLKPLTEFRTNEEARGATVLVLARDRKALLGFSFLDSARSGAADLIRALRADGLKVRMLTGDQASAAIEMGRQLGLEPDEIHAGVRPEGKAAVIRDLQQSGARVAFVGDGLNDGPALAQADLGIAVSRATDVAREAADIVLLRADLTAVPVALALARSTLRVIRQNLFWAFFYNAAAIPLAMLGFMSPIVCALTMGLSDVVVVGNALRLLRRRGSQNPNDTEK
jgi:Cu+-exporting ATPase